MDETEVENKKPRAIGGWLILVAIGIVVSPIRTISMLYTTYLSLFSEDTWTVLTDRTLESFSLFLLPYLVCELVINVAIISITFYIVYLFFSRKAALPKWYFGISLFSTTFLVIDAYIVSLIISDSTVFDPDTVKELLRSLVSLLIWSPYLLYSQRSKETFVSGRT